LITNSSTLDQSGKSLASEIVESCDIRSTEAVRILLEAADDSFCMGFIINWDYLLWTSIDIFSLIVDEQNYAGFSLLHLAAKTGRASTGMTS
jgi:hypothetical protein